MQLVWVCVLAKWAFVLSMTRMQQCLCWWGAVPGFELIVGELRRFLCSRVKFPDSGVLVICMFTSQSQTLVGRMSHTSLRAERLVKLQAARFARRNVDVRDSLLGCFD